MRRGTIGRYHWGEFWNEGPPLSIPAVVAGLAGHLMNLRGVNVSWDSGLLRPADPALPPGWTYEGKHAVSPPITQALAERWPNSGDSFDEWYFFQHVPPLFNLNAYCNYPNASLADAADVRFLGGISLQEQLERWVPEAVIGAGYHIFVLAADESAVDAFSRLAREA